MRIPERYDTDFAERTRHNAELLRSGRAPADLEHIAEEIEDMGSANSAPCTTVLCA
jgi:hypothetical protein